MQVSKIEKLDKRARCSSSAYLISSQPILLSNLAQIRRQFNLCSCPGRPAPPPSPLVNRGEWTTLDAPKWCARAQAGVATATLATPQACLRPEREIDTRALSSSNPLTQETANPSQA